MLPYQAGINFQDKDKGQKHEGEELHEAIQAAHEPARSEKKREGRAHHAFLAKRGFPFSTEGQTPDSIDQKTPADEDDGNPEADHTQSSEVDPVDVLYDPVSGNIEKRTKITGYA